MRPISETGFESAADEVASASACVAQYPPGTIGMLRLQQILNATAIGLRCDADARFMECDQSRTGRVCVAAERGDLRPTAICALQRNQGRAHSIQYRFAFEFDR